VEQNPYAPPKSVVADVAAPDGDPVAPTLPLYSTTQIGVATFFGSALAGAWLAAGNYKAVAQPRQAARVWWLGIVVTTVTMAVAFVLPDRFPNSILPLAVAFGARAMAEQRFGAVVKAYQAEGGELRSWWRVAGISVLSAVIVLAVIALGVFGYYLVIGEGP
jgi:cytochrome c-type biogenesis protein CcmH/NrfG